MREPSDGGTIVDRPRRERDRLGAWQARGAEPTFPHVVSMTWRDGLFCHWPVDPATLEDRIPEPLELDTRDGEAWLSVLPFVLTRAGLRGSPSITRVTAPELNVRTYVRYGGDGGLYFFSVDVDAPAIAAATRRLTRLPVHHAAMHVSAVDGEVVFSSARQTGDRTPVDAQFGATYRPDGEVFHADPDSLAGWLTGRRRFYAPGADDAGWRSPGVLTGEIAHAPWPLQEASVDVQRNTLFTAMALPDPDVEPVAHYCGRLPMTGSIVRRL